MPSDPLTLTQVMQILFPGLFQNRQVRAARGNCQLHAVRWYREVVPNFICHPTPLNCYRPQKLEDVCGVLGTSLRSADAPLTCATLPE